MSKVLVCGSIALDLLGSYAGSFADYQQKYGVSALNISLQLSGLRTSFGGCGMNITYGLRQFNVDAVPLSAAGANFNDAYQPYLESLGVDISNIAVDDTFPQCATAILLTDKLGNQITGFYAGGAVSPRRRLPSQIPGIEDFKLAVLAPEDAPIMLRQGRDLKQLGVSIVFDPGQGIAEFARADVRELLAISDYVIANSHEWDILQHNSGMGDEEIINGMDQVIVTRSAAGVDIFSKDLPPVHVDAIPPLTHGDATGCGDAFRAGYVTGLMADLSPRDCARMGSLTATYSLEHTDPQGYEFTPQEFHLRYEQSWLEPLGLAI